MKIGDIKVGEEYAALDNPRYGRRTLPRRVRVEEIVSVPERRYRGVWSKSEQVNVRKLKVMVLDDPSDNYARGIDRLAKGATTVIETRKIVGPWTAEITKEVDKATSLAKQRDETEEALEARIEALGLDHTSVRVDLLWGEKIDIILRASGGDVERFLSALEALA